MKISVAVCTYNGEKFIERQLVSIFSQTLKVDEVIIVDDGSTDNTIKIVNEIKKIWPDELFFEVNKKNLGVRKNFEKAIFKCSGDIIFLSDQDDVWYENKVEKILNKFNESSNIEAIFSDGLLIDENGISLNTSLFKFIAFDKKNQNVWKDGGAALEIVKGLNKITGATLAIRRELFIRSVPFIQDLLLHDSWLGLNAAVLGRLDWIDEPLIEYRIHENQQVGLSQRKREDIDSLNKGDIMFKYLEGQKLELDLMKKVFVNYNTIENITINNLKIEYEKQEKIVRLLKFRLQLPRNFILRVFLILKKINAYYKVLPSAVPVKTILSDMFFSLR